MATQEDVRQIALSLPEVIEGRDRFAFSVMNKGKPRGIAWVWLERVHPKKSRVPNPGVIAVTVSDLIEKDLRLAALPGALFTEPHYNGYPAVLVRLADIGISELRELIVNAWFCQAPAVLTQKFKEDPGRTSRE